MQVPAHRMRVGSFVERSCPGETGLLPSTLGRALASRLGIIQALGANIETISTWEEEMKGSCLCSAIEYEVDQLDKPIVHCHCRTCQKANAAASVPTAGVLREHFRWLKGKDKLAVFESSPGKLRHFCSACGSHLMAERPTLPFVMVRVATLDEDPGTKPEMHIWCSHDVSWLTEGKEVPLYPEWHPGK